jgi:hypothetical protein
VDGEYPVIIGVKHECIMCRFGPLAYPAVPLNVACHPPFNLFRVFGTLIPSSVF